ncbi:unnamed protein product, partial [Phaedon cochleariae]
MKKTYNPTDINQNKGQELSKKLYRAVSDQAKRLDDARSCARNIGDLFTPNLLVQRKKFCEFSERLIFTDYLSYGHKGEELLWRKGYYDVVSTAKKLKKNEYQPDELSCIQAHINSGIGFYHHMISRLQYEFSLNINNSVDFTMLLDDNKQSIDNDKEAVEWAKQSIHQCLIYLGDLNRYKIEIFPNWDSTLAVRYYLQAISYKPDYGMPHNQMGNLALNQNHLLKAVYHYMRCLSCKFPFEGTSNNLLSLFEKNSKFIEHLPQEDKNADCIIEPGQSEKIKIFLARFLLLIDIWYFNKKIPKVYDLCHQTYKNLEECLSFVKSSVSESGESPTDFENDQYLTSDLIFKMVVICLLCLSKLKSDNSSQLSTLIAFILGIYSQLVQNVTSHIEQSVLNFPITENAKIMKGTGILKDLMNGYKRSKTKLRRRKALNAESEDDESEGSDAGGYRSCSSSDDSFISDDEDVLAVSSDEESDIVKVSDESNCATPKQSLLNGLSNGHIPPSSPQATTKTKEDILAKVRLMNVNDMIEIIAEESTLQTIKILSDWLKNNPEVLKSCGANTGALIRQVTNLLNLININLRSPKIVGLGIKVSEIISKENEIPLTEDVLLKGVETLADAHGRLNWRYTDKRGLSLKEEAMVRVVKLIAFGKFLTGVGETEMTYDEGANKFVCKLKEDVGVDGKDSAALLDQLDSEDRDLCPSNGSTSARPSRDLSKMKHMGELWLAAEVRALESRVGGLGMGVGGMGGRAALSPYLVLDAEALIRYTYVAKQLVNARKFIVVVPTTVVSALDDLKREKIEARDAIRWLESQFHRGNRFFRAQRPQEKAPIPFIKYPKKKDKEMHTYIQIIECCYFLAEQQKGASNVVTLLIGNQNVLTNGENKEFSYVGLAQSVGIAIESISSFHG